MYRLFYFALLVLFAIACEPTPPQNGSEDPSDLEFVTDIATDGSGKVIVTATAKNTVEYRFYMGDNGTEEPYSNQNGVYEHFYELLGTYIVEVRAYGSSGRYIKATRQIVVIAGDPVTIGEGYTTPVSYEGMTLVWNDEFEGDQLNTTNWAYEEGNGCPDLCGWGNNELEYYRAENCAVYGGTLVLEARDESFEEYDYTSGKIVSRDLQSFKYGRVDIRALLPKGQGIWPALWMLGTNHYEIGWPKCGEIDIMEMIGGQGRENTVHGNMYWYENGTMNQPDFHSLDSGTFNVEYHVFSIVWNEASIQWLMNDIPFHQISITDNSKEAFHKPFYFIMNVAVGGNWPGSPDDTTVFPTQMRVDYVRVFQQA
jgi:beta-glucanase (GH16 family)